MSMECKHLIEETQLNIYISHQILMKTKKNPNKTLTADVLGLEEKLGVQAHKLELLLPKLLGPQYKYLLEKGAQAFEPLKYEKKHNICHKHFLYYSSRLGIVFNPTK
jgi:hypothetical protein